MKRLLGFGGLVVLATTLAGAAPASADHLLSVDHPTVCMSHPLNSWWHFLCVGEGGGGY